MKRTLKRILICLLVLFILECFYLGYKDEKNRIKYDYVGDISEGKVAVSDGIDYGYFDIFKKEANLKYKLPKQDNISLSNYKYIGGFAIYDKDNYQGIINHDGKIIINTKKKYENIKIVNDRLFIAYKNNLYYLLDMSGKKLTKGYKNYKIIENSNLINFYDGEVYQLYNIEKNDYILSCMNISYINDNDNYIFTCIDDKTNKNYLYDNKKNSIVYLNNLDDYKVDSFIGDNAILKLDNKTYNFNIGTGKVEEYKNTYDEIYPFVHDRALAIINNKAGYIDKKENIKIKFELDNDSSSFNENDIALVSKNSKKGIINKKGKTIIPFDYDYINILNNDKFIVKNDNKVYIIKQDKSIVSDEYDDIKILDDNNLLTKKNNKFGLIDYNGNVILKTSYDEIKVFDKIIIFKYNNRYYLKLM